MKHVRRAIKYFIQVVVIFAVIIGALMLLGFVSTDVNVAFRNGWHSIGYIAGLFFVVSLVYPFFGYGKRIIRAKGEPSEYRAAIDEAMKQRGYVFEKEEDGALRYRLSSGVAKAARLWEDAVTIKPTLGGFEAEGLMRDLARVVSSIDHNINSYE
jgi:hypothetical protein